MMTSYRFTWLIAILSFLTTACSGGDKVENEQFDFLNDMGITVTEKLLLGDTLTMPDVYCGDSEQTTSDLKGKNLNHDQYAALIVPAGYDFPNDMSNWVLIGARDMGSGVTLAAFYAGDGMGYCVDLMTYNKQGHVLDAINARELHLLWRTDLTDINNDSVFTLDGYFTFVGDRVTLHRTMGRCVMDFDKDLKSKPLWQQTWVQDYVINAKGHFVLQGQRVVDEQGQVDQYAALDFKSWDMLVCSLYDPSIMDTWNEYSELVNSTYDPDYQFNPFPWDVTQLYRMNPQRFLNWMGAPRNRSNRLLPCFKLLPNERPELLKEIARMDDSASRQWLTSIVNNWDDQPLTKHL